MSYSPPLAYYLRRKKTRPGGLLDASPGAGANAGGFGDFTLTQSATTADAGVGDVVGALSTSGASGHPADFSLSTPTTTTDASVGDVIGTLS